MTNETFEKWKLADDNRRLWMITRELVGEIAMTYLPLGSATAAPYLAAQAVKIENCEAEMRRAEAELGRELDGDDTAWMRDAMRSPEGDAS